MLAQSESYYSQNAEETEAALSENTRDFLSSVATLQYFPQRNSSAMEGGLPYSGESNHKEATGVTPDSAAAAHSDEDDGYEDLTSFRRNQEQKETSDLTGANRSPKNSLSPNSSMTTKELQEYWRNEKRNCRAVKVLFEIPSARIVEKAFSKYVKYQIIIIQTGSFDSNRSIIERRYSDFERLHANLLKTFYDEMEDVPFPKKSLTGNFTEDVIMERKLAFQDYLRLLYSMECIQTSSTFIDFLIGLEMEEAYSCLRGGQYTRALEIFLQVVPLQEKLIKHRPILLVPTLCAILICHKDLDDSRSGYEFGEKALRRLQNHPKHRYFMPLLETMISMAYELGKDFVSLQEKLEERRAKKGPRKAVTLKELAVQDAAMEGDQLNSGESNQKEGRITQPFTPKKQHVPETLTVELKPYPRPPFRGLCPLKPYTGSSLLLATEDYNFVERPQKPVN